MPGRVGNAVPIVTDRENARVVPVPFLDKDMERREAAGHNREAGGPESEPRLPSRILERGLGSTHILAKLARCEHVHELMVVAVRGDFMTARRHLTHQRWIVFGDP